MVRYSKLSCLLTFTLVFSLFTDKSGKIFPLALVVYKFDGVCEHEVLVRPHGNAKSNKPYRRTRESTKTMLKLELEHCDPKEAVDKVYEKRGGVVSAKSAGELPRGRTQAYNIKRQLQQEQLTTSMGGKGFEADSCKDMLYVVMQCKNSEKKDCFVQEVTCAPEPMGVLATEQQLCDIVRFSTDHFNFCVLGIDPTFNLGDFSVTPIVYTHLLLQDPQTKRSPLMPGPMLVHSHKLFRSYNYFLSTLIGLKPEIAAVKAVGTDGEHTLVEAVLRNFPQAVHLRCFRHLQQNIERHLHDLNFPHSAVRSYINDIFGWSDGEGMYHEGLVDCSDGPALTFYWLL